MDWKKEAKVLLIIAGVFLGFYYLPIGSARFENAVFEALHLAKWYAREHVILCLLPAFFIAGAISAFISQQSVIKYFGAGASKLVAYGVASVSGAILAVCSCTVLPIFAGIKRMGAGIGPATTFLYSGPAINVMAVILTASVLGVELGIARAVGAVIFSILIGVGMQLLFPEEEISDVEMQAIGEDNQMSLPRQAVYFALMVGILVFANWGGGSGESVYYFIAENKWAITAAVSAALAVVLVVWLRIRWWKILAGAAATAIVWQLFSQSPEAVFSAGIISLSVILITDKEAGREWLFSSWDFAKQIMPLLFFGVLIAGFLLGSPEGEGVIPGEWVNAAVGGNSFGSTLFASVVGAFMYFATLTEVPILQGLIAGGMGKGPALALLLAGPALSLPNMLVIRSVIGWRKTIAYIILVVVMSTAAGMIYGNFF